MVDSKFRNREPHENSSSRRTGSMARSPIRERFRRSREIVSAQNVALERLVSLVDDLRGSRLWRLVEGPLRWCMNPGTLGRGNTILDDMLEQLRELRDGQRRLTNSLVPADVCYEQGTAHHGGTYPAAVLVTNWNGAGSLEAFLDSYARHHAPEAAELIIVDHASSDDSVARIRRWMDRLPIKLLRCNRNQRYATANNLAAAYTDSPCLVFANNDILFESPVVPGLLRALAEPSVCLVGVPLYYPDHQEAGDRRIQHAGIRFSPAPHLLFMRPHNVREPAPEGEGCRRVAAVTGALAACRREDFESVGGFLEDYDYGFEDVDLSLSLQNRLGQHVVVCDELSAVHDESRTQRSVDHGVLVARRRRNAGVLRARHGAQLAREVLRSQLDDGIWHNQPLRVRLPAALGPWRSAGVGLSGSVQLESDADLDERARERFCGYWLLDDPLELAGAALPGGAEGVALVTRDQAENWLQVQENRSIGFYLCQSERDRDTLLNGVHSGVARWTEESWPPGPSSARTLLERLHEHQQQPSIAIRIATPTAEDARFRGDFHFAEGLGRALRDRGYRVNVDRSADAQRRRISPDDVTLTLRGLHRFPAPAAGLNLLWLVSHAERVSDPEFETYDHIFVASEAYARQLAARINAPVTCLLQCTDPERFRFIEAPSHPERIVFVGNSRGVEHPVLKAALSQGLEPEVYGRGWADLVNPALLQGEYIENGKLGSYYGNSGVVLADHWPQMRRDGFVSNRVFDALATGAGVVSDAVQGLEDLFGDQVRLLHAPTDDLAELCRAASRDRAARRELAFRVREEHSFAARAKRIDNLIRSHMPAAGSEGARRSAA